MVWVHGLIAEALATEKKKKCLGAYRSMSVRVRRRRSIRLEPAREGQERGQVPVLGHVPALEIRVDARMGRVQPGRRRGHGRQRGVVRVRRLERGRAARVHRRVLARRRPVLRLAANDVRAELVAAREEPVADLALVARPACV
jgi:hypothetical protein